MFLASGCWSVSAFWGNMDKSYAWYYYEYSCSSLLPVFITSFIIWVSHEFIHVNFRDHNWGCSLYCLQLPKTQPLLADPLGTLGKQTGGILSTIAMEMDCRVTKECHLLTGAGCGGASASLLATTQFPCRQQPGAVATGHTLFFRSGYHLHYVTKQNSHTVEDCPTLST